MISYTKENNTYKANVSPDIRDRIDVEIGDSKQLDFKPQFKVMRWDNEVNFSIRAEEKPNAQEDFENGVIKYKTKNYEVHQYEKPEASKEGGFEFEWVLKKVPSSNILTATIQHKNLIFYYQPPLTQEEIDEGCVRPDNVVGSYAAYYQNCPDNIKDKKVYRNGKAFHIYRPKAKDSLGNWTWCDLHIENGLLTVTVPQLFLDSAIYPVVVDPTFGYTTVGGTEDGNWQTIANTATPSAAGNAFSLSIYCYCDSGTHTLRGAIWDDSAGVPNNRDILGAVSGSIGVGVGNVGWAVSLFSSEAFIVEALHHGATVDNSTTNLFSAYYDATGGVNAFEIGTITTPPNPFGTGTTRTNRSYSNYVTYNELRPKSLNINQAVKRAAFF